MSYCRKCGTQLQDGTRFCAMCGTPTGNEQSYINTPPAADGRQADGIQPYANGTTTNRIQSPYADGTTMNGAQPYSPYGATLQPQDSRKALAIIGTLVLFIVVVALILLIVLLTRNFDNTSHSEQQQTETITEQPIEQDAYEHINRFFEQYYEASASGDVETYTSMRSFTDETERILMQKKANYIDYYQNLSCYTKPGPTEHSYLVYVYYEVKFLDIRTPAPGVNTFYLCTSDAGELYIYSGEIDQDVANYIGTVTMQEDVQDLFHSVKVMYNNAVTSDEELEEFFATFSEMLRNDVERALTE